MKRIYHILLFILSLTITVSLSSCGHEHDGEHGHAHDEESTAGDHDDQEHGEHEEEGIVLSQDQMEKIGLEFGQLSEMKINDYITATGTLGLPPNAYSSVSAKAAGFIRNSNKYVEGSYINQGTVMAYLENPEFIVRQQEFLEIKAELGYLKQELARQKALVEANAGIEKTVQKLQADISVKEAQYKGTEKYLKYLGIHVDELTTDKIQQRIIIVAPITGYLTSINMHNGMYVEPQMELMEIVDESHLHLELDVFEKDIGAVVEEQKITYTVPAMGGKMYEGEVHVIGKEFNAANKTVRIHGHLHKERPTFIKDLFISAKIWLNDQTVTALPEDAVIKDGADSYIYAGLDDDTIEEIEFEKIRVIPGTQDDGFIAVKLLDDIPEDMKIVTKGAYYVYAQSKAGELEHEH